jgi:hypothetical protein
MPDGFDAVDAQILAALAEDDRRTSELVAALALAREEVLGRCRRLESEDLIRVKGPRFFFLVTRDVVTRGNYDTIRDIVDTLKSIIRRYAAVDDDALRSELGEALGAVEADADFAEELLEATRELTRSELLRMIGLLPLRNLLWTLTDDGRAAVASGSRSGAARRRARR